MLLLFLHFPLNVYWYFKLFTDLIVLYLLILKLHGDIYFYLLDSFLLPLNSKYDLNRIKWLYFKMFHIHALKIILENDLMQSIHTI